MLTGTGELASITVYLFKGRRQLDFLSYCPQSWAKRHQMSIRGPLGQDTNTRLVPQTFGYHLWATATCLSNGCLNTTLPLSITCRWQKHKGIKSHKSWLTAPFIPAIFLMWGTDRHVGRIERGGRGHNWTVKIIVSSKWSIWSGDSAVSGLRDEKPPCLSRTEEQNERSEQSQLRGAAWVASGSLHGFPPASVSRPFPGGERWSLWKSRRRRSMSEKSRPRHKGRFRHSLSKNALIRRICNHSW